MENRVCENQETTIMRTFEFRKEGLEYLQKLPLEEKITLSKNLIVSCMESLYFLFGRKGFNGSVISCVQFKAGYPAFVFGYGL